MREGICTHVSLSKCRFCSSSQLFYTSFFTACDAVVTFLVGVKPKPAVLYLVYTECDVVVTFFSGGESLY